MAQPTPPASEQELRQALAAARARVRELERALSQRTGLSVVDDATFARTLISHLPDYVYFKDHERRFVRFSDSFEALLGRPAAEIVGRRDEDLFPPEIARETVADDRQVIEEGIPLINKLEGGEVAPGIVRWVRTTKLPWRDNDGKVLGLFGLSRDVTAQKQLEDSVSESERRLRTIGDTVPFPVATVRISDGTLLYANEALAKFVGRPLENLVGRLTPEFYAHAGARETLLARLRAEGRVEGAESDMRRHDGTLVTVSATLIPILIDGQPAVMATAADITELKAREAQLCELSAQKDLLLREVNHRVRNNLATLSALIRQQLRTTDSASREALGRIEQSVQGLAAAHAMLSKSGWRPIEVATLCREVVGAALRELDPAPALRVNDPGLRADSQPAHQLALVMAELATNSMKHVADTTGLAIDVTIEATAFGLCIEYRDNGPGFPAAVLDGLSRGTGLRLVDGLVSYGLSGRMSLCNDRGAVTTLELPALEALAGAPLSGPLAPDGWEGK